MPTSEISLLRELLAHEDELTSGEHLARRLGVSRVAVWAQVRKLEKSGYRFEAVPRRGYRLLATPALLHAPLIQARLSRLPRPPRLICLDSVDSTNREAGRRLAAGEAVPLVILARAQTSGTGRLGRPWHSAANGNLYATFAFRPEIAPERLHDFTLWMGLSLCELVADFCGLEPGLKWPNDLHLGGRKAGGMLTEARIDADRVHELVFGLGLNVNSRPTDLPPGLRRTATSLAEATGAPLDLNTLAGAVIGRVDAAYRDFLDGRYRPRFAALWPRFDLLRAQSITLMQGTRTVRGTALGIDPEGSLLVRLDSGRTERFRAGEVTLGRDGGA